MHTISRFPFSYELRHSWSVQLKLTTYPKFACVFERCTPYVCTVSTSHPTDLITDPRVFRGNPTVAFMKLTITKHGRHFVYEFERSPEVRIRLRRTLDVKESKSDKVTHYVRPSNFRNGYPRMGWVSGMKYIFQKVKKYRSGGFSKDFRFNHDSELNKQTRVFKRTQNLAERAIIPESAYTPAQT